MIKNLYKEATSSKGTLPFSNYFDVKDGFKKNLKKWKYDYQESFNFDEAILDKAYSDTCKNIKKLELKR